MRVAELRVPDGRGDRQDPSQRNAAQQMLHHSASKPDDARYLARTAGRFVCHLTVDETLSCLARYAACTGGKAGRIDRPGLILYPDQ